MQLTVGDRIVLLDLLPREGSFLTMKIIRQLRDALYFSEEELAEFGLKQDGAAFNWTSDRAVEIAIGPKAREVVAGALQALDAAGKITDREFTLYERFAEQEA
jgi:hypothetical protein